MQRWRIGKLCIDWWGWDCVTNKLAFHPGPFPGSWWIDIGPVSVCWGY